MTRVIVDAETWSKLRNARELLELCDRSGQTLGYYQPAFRIGVVEGGRTQSPYTDEEIEKRHQQEGGETLAAFWKALAEQ